MFCLHIDVGFDGPLGVDFCILFWISKLGNSKHIHALVMGTQMYGIGFDFSWIGMVIQSAFYLMD